MSIITQANLTSLRKLKYGHDTPGGGNSGEPYVAQSIPPASDQQVSSTNIWKSDNGLIRGGFVGAARASYLDTVRIGKFLVDPPRGPLFIAKQVGLQLSNPKLEIKQVRTDFGGILGAVINLGGKINNAVGPTRIYNLGINTLAQVPVNAFGGHIVRHGFLPVFANDQKYASVAVANDASGTYGANNRLVQLKVKLEKNENANISQYVSGPGSTDGIGTTIIRRFSKVLNNPNYKVYNKTAPIHSNSIDYFSLQGLSIQYFNDYSSLIYEYNNIVSGSSDSKPTQIDQNVIDYSPAGKTYNKLQSAIENQIANSRIGGVSPNITNDPTGSVTFTFAGKSRYKNSKYPNGLPLDAFNIDNRLGLSESGKGDTINLTPLYLSENPPGTTVTIDGKSHNVRDLIKFRIEAVDGDKPSDSVWMIFRAYVKDINDDPNPSWNTINYIGRGEPFYIYKGFERNISFTFQVAAMSEKELEPMWQKLNYLYSNTMPDYNNNVMRGPYMRLTLGNYLYRQPGIIKSLGYTIDDKSPWEIAISDPEAASPLYELPHVLTVRMTFAPIHNFLPRKFPPTYDNWNELPAFVADRPEVDNKWLTDIFTDKKIPTGK